MPVNAFSIIATSNFLVSCLINHWRLLGPEYIFLEDYFVIYIFPQSVWNRSLYMICNVAKIHFSLHACPLGIALLVFKIIISLHYCGAFVKYKEDINVDLSKNSLFYFTDI